MKEVLQSVKSDDRDVGPSGVTYPQPAKRKRGEEESPSAGNSACTETIVETNEMSSVDLQSDVLEREEPELPAELEEKEIVASEPEGNYSKECSSCKGMLNEGRQLRNTVKTLREKLKKKREALRAAQRKLKGMFSIQTNDYGSSCSSRHFEKWRGMSLLFPSEPQDPRCQIFSEVFSPPVYSKYIFKPRTNCCCFDFYLCTIKL